MVGGGLGIEDEGKVRVEGMRRRCSIFDLGRGFERREREVGVFVHVSKIEQDAHVLIRHIISGLGLGERDKRSHGTLAFGF